ncbi:GNAT family N-acetyltransferase [Sinorhizobium sp. RAC02]|uniref:GNAT family N-acetyltransferase n=1 Tax=Sinorhizobium sp. RAC02 TaxID=1842534 RepID=UPI00083DC88B|nr:GNAT family N-acetyltransferase [Sinorhizobium sp. RAC02]AOF92025.1 acetyltransferase family protein [Sinorhizobium sp. RAC02]
MPVDRPGLTFRTDYLDDAAAWQAVADLLDDTFGIDVTALDRFGGPDPTCTAFAWFDDAGACVANLSAFALPLVVDGVFLHAAGLQSGAVRPSHRGRGLYRDVMQAALDHCDAKGFEAVALLTESPGLYERHGFRTLPQHRFSGPPPEDGHACPVRRLHIQSDDDVTLLCRLLDGRKPVSDRFSPMRQREMFLFNALLMPDVKLDLLEEGDVVVAWRLDEHGRFELLDIVGASIPSLADILASLGISPSRVIVRFAPDRLAWDGAAVQDEGDMVLMLRGAENLRPEKPFALPPMAEF